MWHSMRYSYNYYDEVARRIDVNRDGRTHYHGGLAQQTPPMDALDIKGSTFSYLVQSYTSKHTTMYLDMQYT